MLLDRIPVSEMTGIVVLHAEDVSPTSMEAFVMRVYREKNKVSLLRQDEVCDKLIVSTEWIHQSFLRRARGLQSWRGAAADSPYPAAYTACLPLPSLSRKRERRFGKEEVRCPYSASAVERQHGQDTDSDHRVYGCNAG